MMKKWEKIKEILVEIIIIVLIILALLTISVGNIIIRYPNERIYP